MKKIYLAAPLFSVFERNINVYIANEIEKTQKYNVFLPQKISPIKEQDIYNMKPIYDGCKDNIINSDIVLAIVDGSDVDSGVAWELGYAFACNIPTLCIRTDIRKSEGNGVNIMIEYSATKTIYLTKYNQTVNMLIEKIIAELEEFK